MRSPRVAPPQVDSDSMHGISKPWGHSQPEPLLMDIS